MAALRAKTIHKTTSINKNTTRFESGNVSKPSACSSFINLHPRKKPIMAKGMAKMVWENLIRERYFFMVFIKDEIVWRLAFGVWCLLFVVCGLWFVVCGLLFKRFMGSISSIGFFELRYKFNSAITY